MSRRQVLAGASDGTPEQVHLTWSDNPATGVDPGHGSDGQPSIKVTHYHAVGADPVNPGTGVKGAPTPDYTEFETFTLVRPR